MNPYALVVVERPQKTRPQGSKEDVESREWATFEHNLLENALIWPNVDIPAHTSPEIRLAENVWLIALQSGLPFLGKLVVQAKIAELSVRFLYFDDKPEWISAYEKPPSSGNQS